jgi:hypothetical protein
MPDLDTASLRAMLAGGLPTAPIASISETVNYPDEGDLTSWVANGGADGGYWWMLGGDEDDFRTTSQLVEAGAEVTRVSIDVKTLYALLDAAEQWEAPSAASWKRARLERDALRKDRDCLRRAISDFLDTYTLHADITRGLADVLARTDPARADR